jgi:uncharacterized membrane protein
MYKSALMIGLAMVAACGSREGAGNSTVDGAGEPTAADSSGPAAPAATAGRWDLQASGEGTALALLLPSGATAMRLFCPADGGRLLVNMPGFAPIGSEERMTFGSSGEAATLVADARGDLERGGVSGAGPVPANLAALVGGPLVVNYGAQASGPHAAAPPQLAQAFVAACQPGPPAAGGSPPAVSPCLIQGEERLQMKPLKAVGTEPFWSARIEGRCVTYSHPEDIDGTRVWTRYTPGPSGGSWTGALQGRPFELRISAQPGCSDGMSDNVYPLGAELLVQGERRSGCAEPA